MADVHLQEPSGGTNDRSFGYLTRLLVWLGVISLAFIVFVIVAPINPWFPEATRESQQVDFLFKFMLASGGAIIIYVEGLILGFAMHFRRQKHETNNDIGVQTHGNTRLEIAWTIAPTVLLVVLTAMSLVVWSNENSQQKNPLQLYVHGYQYGWGFQLHQYGISSDVNPVSIPVNRPVYVSEWSTDVIHSFWVPEFRIKQDVVPLGHDTHGRQLTTHEEFTPVRTGSYRVICTEFCGSGHASMNNATVNVVTQAEFESWVLKHGGKLPTGTTIAAASRP